MSRFSSDMRSLLCCLVCVVLSACNSLPEWMGGEEEQMPLKGERISVLTHGSTLKADPKQQAQPMYLPPSRTDTAWSKQQIAPYAHPALDGALPHSITERIGKGAKKGARFTSTPLIHQGKLYVLDGAGRVSARDAKEPDEVRWDYKMAYKTMQGDLLGLGLVKNSGEKKPFLGGNLTAFASQIFVATLRGQVVALDATSGAMLWERQLKVPAHALSVGPQGVYVLAAGNRLYALNRTDGSTYWTHNGLREVTSVFGTPVPVPFDNRVLVAYSSGELVALNAQDGKVVWQRALVNTRRQAQVALAFKDINATPVVVANTVFAIGHSGVLLALDAKTGAPRWQQELSATHTPWAAGDFLFVITTDQELVCLSQKDGSVRWVKQPSTHDQPMLGWGETKKGNPIQWSGPVLAGKQLIVAGSRGQLQLRDPGTGEVIRVLSIPKAQFLPPVPALGRLYLLNNDARLTMLY